MSKMIEVEQKTVFTQMLMKKDHEIASDSGGSTDERIVIKQEIFEYNDDENEIVYSFDIKEECISDTEEGAEICNSGVDIQVNENVVEKSQTDFPIQSYEKKHCCKHCDKSFSCKSWLVRHLRIHTGEKPYKCEVCNESFSDQSNLSSHKRIHTGEKPHLCNHCNRSFRRSDYFVSHLRTHTGEKPYKCEVCNKSFSAKSSLSRHKQTHTGEKSNVCKHCNKSFHSKDYFISHLRTHTGEKR